jgi:hypothetical protein
LLAIDRVYLNVSTEKRTVNLASLDVIADILGATSIDLATTINQILASEYVATEFEALHVHRKCGSKDLQDGTTKLLGKRTGAHGAGDLDDLVKRDGLGVLDVLLLLAVTGRLLEGTDDEGRGGGNNRDRGLTVLDGELDGDTETFLLIARLRVSDSVSSMTCSGKEVLTQSPVALAISSPVQIVSNMKTLSIAPRAENSLPIFLGDKPKGPTLGASAD